MRTKEELQRFYETINSNEELQSELQSHTDPQTFHKVIVAKGQELGFNLSEEEIEALLSSYKEKELNTKELGEVVGGHDAISFLQSLNNMDSMDHCCPDGH